jgi:hypothetical protein
MKILLGAKELAIEEPLALKLPKQDAECVQVVNIY